MGMVIYTAGRLKLDSLNAWFGLTICNLYKKINGYRTGMSFARQDETNLKLIC